MVDKSEEIFLLNDQHVTSMPERPMRLGLFGKTLEDALQTLLEKHPEVIPGKQIAPGSEEPPKFFLLRREMPVSGWSLDHLFVDQRGVLTLVEAKLIQNPESRRDVIGQIIEYAANAIELWAHGKLRQYATAYYGDRGSDLDSAMRESFGDDLDVDGFWAQVDENLADGKLRLIIASDQIRNEVRRMIEYLNTEMHRVEVLGLELKCYGHDDASMVLVPRIIGQTQASIDRRTITEKPVRWTKERLAENIEAMPEGILKQRIKRVFDWAVTHNRLSESSSKNFSLGIGMRDGGQGFLWVYRDGTGYVGLTKNRFGGNEEIGKTLLAAFVKLGLLSGDKSYEQIRDGRYFAKPLDQLDQASFDAVLDVLDKYTGKKNQ